MAGVITSKLIAGLRRVAFDLDPDCMAGVDALAMLRLVAEGERLCAGMKLRLIKRIEDTNTWKAEGYRSAAHLLAAETGVSVGHAMRVLETARRLNEQSRLEDAVRTGELSEAQTREVSEAASEEPAAERELLDTAKEDGFAGLKREAARVKANARTAEQEAEREERIHRTRYVDHWIDAEGAGRGEWKLPKPAHARLVAALRVEQDRIFKQARGEGRHEPHRAYAADALVALADRAGGDPTTKRRAAKARVIARVDLAGVRRGTTISGEACEIKGVGPVSAEDMRDLLGDALLTIVLTNGVDVMNVTRVGRTCTAEIKDALEWLYTECGVHGCPTLAVRRAETPHGSSKGASSSPSANTTTSSLPTAASPSRNDPTTNTTSSHPIPANAGRPHRRRDDGSVGRKPVGGVSSPISPPCSVRCRG